MKKLIFLFAVMFAAWACAPSTEIVGSWRKPQINKTYNKVMVAALTSDLRVKNALENSLADALSEVTKVDAYRSTEFFSPNFTDDMNDRTAMLNKINNNGMDAILTVAIIDTETETRYIPGDYRYTPFRMYNFWGYYSYWYPRIYDPGYYIEDKIYFIEANLYDAETEELLWSAQSESYNPGSLQIVSEEVSSALARELNRENVFSNPS